MFNVCIKCGSYRVDKIIDPKGAYAICPDCGHAHKFKQLPLFIITGATGTGKTSACIGLVDNAPQVVVMESDILWMEEFDKPDNEYSEYREMWLRVCKNISQCGRPVVLCGSVIPSQFESCVERRYFSQIHYLALTCDDGLLAERLKGRPQWRNSGSDEFIREQIKFNNWFKDNAEKVSTGITLLDTSYDPLETTIDKIREWILEKKQQI